MIFTYKSQIMGHLGSSLNLVHNMERHLDNLRVCMLLQHPALIDSKWVHFRL